MAIATATAWEVRTTGSSTNGGGYSSGGTDYSQQDAAQIALTDVATTTSSTSVTSASALFTSAMVGNVVYITGGTAPIATQRRQITVFNSATSVTLDQAPGNTGTGATMNVGGAVESPGTAASAHVAGNTIWVKSGTYSVTSASTNVSGGCVSLTAGTNAAATRFIGYGSTRGDGTKPLLQASGISTFTLVAMAGNCQAANVSVDGASLTGSRGILAGTAGSLVYRCKAANCTNNGIITLVSCPAILCEATGCATQPAIATACAYGCAAYANTVSGFTHNGAGTFTNCVSSNNTGGSSNGFTLSSNNTAVNCAAYANGASGFSVSAEGACINCLAVNNAAYGYTSASADDNAYLFNCAAYNNTSGGFNPNLAANQVGTAAVTANPFTNAPGNDFSLNATAGGGAACRAAGLLGVFPPGLSTTGYADIGAAQHADPASITYVVNAITNVYPQEDPYAA
jgi:hypothetical protein